ncbi:MAG: nucleotidyltransferase substrate binding protein [Pseudomonadales bacterium]|nr:HI0074 family nucleotidyltransferase substrate-binding subunit [Candidatus Woesebacteria bacterium]MCB9802140.1 nucleotidyltransferase substrate binding protein [Pseudomonadales bacterium]
MAPSKITILRESLTCAVAQLDELATVANPSDVERDALIQRFEYTFELGWKYLKALLADQGVLEHSPAKVIKESYRVELIDDLELWLTLLEKRNLTVHMYSQEIAESVLPFSPPLVTATRQLLRSTNE